MSDHPEGIIRGNLFKVEGELVDGYNRALEKTNGNKTSLRSFYVDKRGESPEICGELGKDYLQSGPANRYCIIVSPDQKDAGLIREEFSFDNEIIGFLYENYLPSIAVATRVDALYGEMDDGVRHYEALEDLLLIKKVRLKLRTPSDFLKKARTLQDLVRNLKENPDLLIKNDSKLPKRILELVNEVGDVRNYNLNRIDATIEVGTFYSNLFGGAFVFRDIRTEEVIDMKRPGERRLGPLNQSGNKKKSISVVIYSKEDCRPEDGPLVRFIPLSDRDRVLDFLVSHPCASYSAELLETRLARLEDETLIENGHDVTSMSKQVKARALNEIRDKMPPEWSELMDIKRKIAVGHNFSNIVGGYSTSARSMLLEPARGNGDAYLVVEHLLTKLFPCDYEKMHFHNMEGLSKIFREASENKRKYIGYILGETE